MGSLRFELRSEDPQSPRMARLPYDPALILFAYIPYVSCCDNPGVLTGEKYQEFVACTDGFGKVNVFF